MIIRKGRLFLAAVLFTSCSVASADRPPASVPRGYETYRVPEACAPSSPRIVPSPLNYNFVGRMAVQRYPDMFARGQIVTPFLWFFIREDGSVAEVRLWRSSGSAEMDRIGLEVGRELRWKPLTCGGVAIATWYGHPMGMGGRDR